MKFAHLADCHVGAWREPKLRDLTVSAFEQAIDRCISERVDFLIIAGDLFHTAIPSLDGVKAVFRSLAKLKSASIPLYFICGSHDYSPTGKTMLDIIEEAGLGTNVFRGTVAEGKLRLRWTIDEKTGVKITGILGRANQLDGSIYEQLDTQYIQDTLGEKIFVFHTSIAELKPKGLIIDSAPVSLLPAGCTYYAGGHVHARMDEIIEGRRIVYPGPLFPANFSELEELRGGSFVIVTDGKVQRILLTPKKIVSHVLNCAKLEPASVQGILLHELPDVHDAIVLVRAEGELNGKASDIPWRAIHDELDARGAYVLLRNTAALSSPQLQQVMVTTGTLTDIEGKVIAEHSKDPAFVNALMQSLGSELGEGEKRAAYEERILQQARMTLQEKKSL